MCATGEMLTPAEAAELLGVSRTQVYKQMDMGVIPYVKVFSTRRIPRSYVEGFMERNYQPAVRSGVPTGV